MKLYKKIILIIPLFIVAVLISYIKPKAYTTETLPSGYRLLSADDVGKTFGVNLEVDIIVLETNKICGFNEGIYTTILSTFGVGEVITFDYMYLDEENYTSATIKKNETVIYTTENNKIEGNVIITMTQGENISAVGEYEDEYYKIFYVKDIILPIVTFETNGGNEIDPITSDTLPELEVPIKSGYNFLGWYYDITLLEQAQQGDALTEDITLYASYDKIPIITFETNGGNAIDPITSDTLPELEVPIKNGYNFKGWYYDIDLSQLAQQGDILTEDITLYASFEKPHLLDIINNHITPILLITFGVFATIGNSIINNNILLILFSFVMVLISFGVIRKVFGLIKSFNDKDNDNHNNTHTTII